MLGEYVKAEHAVLSNILKSCQGTMGACTKLDTRLYAAVRSFKERERMNAAKPRIDCQIRKQSGGENN